MNVIKTNNLFKIYQQGDVEVRALNDVSIDFKQGEFTAIVGPSGSGKTTFLNAIGGLDTPTSGNVIINNTDITKLKSNQLIDFRLRNIGFVFQAYNLIRDVRRIVYTEPISRSNKLFYYWFTINVAHK